MKKILAIFILLLHSNCFSETENGKAHAKAIIAFRLKMNPKTEFERWYADQWTLAAINCAAGVGMPIPKEIERLPTFGAGSFSLPKGDFCKALAQGGPVPQCFYLRSTTAPFLFPPNGMASDYVYMKALVKEGTMVTVGGECNLVKDHFETKQFFTGQGKVVWISKPSSQSIMTGNGEVQLKIGTISFQVDGLLNKDMVTSAVLLQ